MLRAAPRACALVTCEPGRRRRAPLVSCCAHGTAHDASSDAAGVPASVSTVTPRGDLPGAVFLIECSTEASPSEASRKIAAAHLGKPKNAAWRSKIAETQRARQALKRQALAALAPAGGKTPRLRSPVRTREQKALARAAANAADVQARLKRAGLPLLAPAPPAKLSKDDIQEYQQDLRHYRGLRKELQIWSDAFAEQHGRRPDKKDVNDTRIPWLIDTFKEYTELKRKLLSRTPALRGSLATAARAELPRPLASGEPPQTSAQRSSEEPPLELVRRMAQPGARRVLIGAGLHADGDARSVLLPHPATGVPAAFLLTPNGALLELNWHKSAYTSWFVGDSVLEDGGVYAATPLDPLFILLPVLERHRQKTATHDGRYCSLEVLLEDERFPALGALSACAHAALPAVCSVQSVGAGEDYYRLDDARALAWLCCKTDTVLAALRSGGAGGGAAFAAMGDSLTGYAVELLGEYVAKPWLQRLQTHLRCTPTSLQALEGGSGVAELAASVPHTDSGANANKKPKQLSKTELQNASRAQSLAAKNAKAASGTRSLASFFGKPVSK